MNISRLITGGVIILLGIWFFVFLGFVDGPKIDFVAISVGILFLVLGVFIIMNKKEDMIEKIKTIKKNQD